MQLRSALFLLTATGIFACTKPTHPSQEVQGNAPGQLFKKENLGSLKLGHLTLRAETAAIAAVTKIIN